MPNTNSVYLSVQPIKNQGYVWFKKRFAAFRKIMKFCFDLIFFEPFTSFTILHRLLSMLRTLLAKLQLPPALPSITVSQCLPSCAALEAFARILSTTDSEYGLKQLLQLLPQATSSAIEVVVNSRFLWERSLPKRF